MGFLRAPITARVLEIFWGASEKHEGPLFECETKRPLLDQDWFLYNQVYGTH